MLLDADPVLGAPLRREIVARLAAAAQLAKQYGYQLATAVEPAGMALGPMLLHRLLKLGAGEQLQSLAENAAYLVQGGCLPSAKWLLQRPTSP